MTIQRLQDKTLGCIISFVPPQDIPVLMGVCRKWAEIIRGSIQHRLYVNLKAQRFTTSSEELGSEYVFLVDQLYRKVNNSIYPTYSFKDFIVAQTYSKFYIFNKEKQCLRIYDDLHFLGIEKECIICWNYKARKIISIDKSLEQSMQDIFCDSLPILWGPFLYYHDRSTQEIVQIDRRDCTRKQICSAPAGDSLSVRDPLYASGSVLYCPCFDYSGRWAMVIDMQTGTLIRRVDNTGTPIGCDKDRYFTLSDDNGLQAYNARGELEQTYEGIQKRPLLWESRMTSFNRCIVYTSYEYELTSSTYIWNSKTGKLLATFPYQFVREDQGKLYFVDKPGQLIIYDCTQSDPMQI